MLSNKFKEAKNIDLYNEVKNFMLSQYGNMIHITHLFISI